VGTLVSVAAVRTLELRRSSELLLRAVEEALEEASLQPSLSPPGTLGSGAALGPLLLPSAGGDKAEKKAPRRLIPSEAG